MLRKQNDQNAVYRKGSSMVKQKEDLDILDEVVSATLLKMAECRIEAIPERPYYLYKRTDGTSFISMIEPEYWNTNRFKIKYISAVKYIINQGWELKDAV